MNRRLFLSAAALIAARFGLGAPAHAANASSWESVTLKQALDMRRSQRAFAERELDEGLLKDLLWAGFGTNRPGTKRTAPSALNRQEIDIYVVRKSGVSLYDAKRNSLVPHMDGDLRALTGTQEFVGDAPVNLVFVSDLAKLGGKAGEDVIPTTWSNAGFISQNVYLFRAAVNGCWRFDGRQIRHPWLRQQELA